MAEKTHINWADATWNPWYGCTKVSPGCKNCYMFRDMTFYGRDPNTVTRSKTAFNAPLKWMKSKKLSPGSRVFTCSWSDWFHKDADQWRDEAWKIVKDTPYVYLILTKRPERILDNLPADWGDGYSNVWLGISAENQDMYFKRWKYLSVVNAAIRFISYEPALGPLSIYWPTIIKPDWLISGGESDKTDPRPYNPDWFRMIRDECMKFGIAYWHKQHGGTKKIDGEWGGRELDGVIWQQLPETKEVV